MSLVFPSKVFSNLNHYVDYKYNMKNKLTIIIVNWNTKEMVCECIYSILKNTQTKPLNLIVVDNNSSDGSRKEIKHLFPGVIVINSGGNLGFSKANNIGYRLVNSELILFLNPDTLILNKAIDEMVYKMEKMPEVGALGCKSYNLNGKPQELGIQWFSSPIKEFIRISFVSEKTLNKLKHILPYQNPYKSSYVKKLYGGCIMVRKTVLDKVGSFDERFFMYAEDGDLCQRIAEKYKLFYASDIDIVHIGGGASEKAPSQFSVLMKQESTLKLMQKYYGLRGKNLFKFYVFLASAFRMTILFLLLGMAKVLRRKTSNTLIGSLKKYSLMIQWALNLKQASPL